jgi:hypothetical protein
MRAEDRSFHWIGSNPDLKCASQGESRRYFPAICILVQAASMSCWAVEYTGAGRKATVFGIADEWQKAVASRKNC